MKRMVWLSVVLLTLCSVTGETSTRGSATATGRSTVRTSSGGSSTGGSSASVTTTVRSSSTGGTTTTTTSSSSTGKGKRKGSGTRKEEVEVTGSSVKSKSRASGTGSVKASATATSTPTKKKGSASTTVGGKTKTVTKTKAKGEKTKKTKRTTTEPPRKTKKRSRSASRFNAHPVCKGLAKWRCCDRDTFATIDKKRYCGCWGHASAKRDCSYEVLNKEPLVVRDIFGGFVGETCRCPAVTSNGMDSCRGKMKRECCDGYIGKKTCQCTGSKCQFSRISNKPLIWRHARIPSRNCVCRT